MAAVPSVGSNFFKGSVLHSGALAKTLHPWALKWVPSPQTVVVPVIYMVETELDREGKRQRARERYRRKRSLMTPEQISACNAHANALARHRRWEDPERVRALERAKYARRIQRDRAGFMATRRAQAKRRQGVPVPDF
jgi:hypothetical protein